MRNQKMENYINIFIPTDKNNLKILELLKNDKLNGVLIGTISSQIDAISSVLESIN